MAYKVNLEYLKKSGKIRGQPIIRRILTLFYPLAYRIKEGQFYYNIPEAKIKAILGKLKRPQEIIDWFLYQIKLYEFYSTKKEAIEAQEYAFFLKSLERGGRDGENSLERGCA